MIEIQNLTKRYGEHMAIESLNFKVEKGEVVGFLGPNGAGKSTTMKILTGFMAPSSGVARVGGFDVFENPIEVKKRIGYLPETPPVYLDMYVEDYLRYVAQLKGVSKAEVQAKVDSSIKKTNLESVRNRLIQNLSKGFRQRVGIAQALVSDPEVLVLDEPTVGLDPIQVSEIRDLIKELRGQHTIILSTHILSEVQATCERIIIIHKGKIVAQDSLANLSNLQRSGGGLQIHLSVKKAENLAAHIQGIRGVKTVVNSGSSPLDWSISTTEGDEAIIEVIAREVMNKGFGLRSISSAKVDLEDFFLKVTYGEGEDRKGGLT